MLKRQNQSKENKNGQIIRTKQGQRRGGEKESFIFGNREKDKTGEKKLPVTLAHRKWDSLAVNGDIDNCCSRIQQKRNQIVS